MLIKLTDIVSDGLHGLILCTFFFITEAEIDASGLDGLGKGVLHPARKPDRGRDSGNAGENICLVSCPERKKSRQGITAQNHRKLWGKREEAFQLRQEISEDKIQSLCGTVSKSFRPPDRRSFPGRKLLIPVSDLKGRKKKIFSGHFFQAGNLFSSPPERS